MILTVFPIFEKNLKTAAACGSFPSKLTTIGIRTL